MMNTVKPNHERAKYAIILIWTVLILDIISFISGYFQYSLIQNILQGGEVSEEFANANDNREQAIGMISLIAYSISIVTFIRWFRRAYYNLHVKNEYLLFSESWATVSWFVPFINLYRPYQIMKELYQETKGLLLSNGFTSAENLSIRFLGWWWALWIISNIYGQFLMRKTMRAELIEELNFATVAGMVANLIGIALALLTIKVIKDYARVESLLSEIKEEVINNESEISAE